MKACQNFIDVRQDFIARQKSTATLCVAVIVLFCFIGCEEKLETGYGRAAGDSYSKSVNGTQILHEMVEASGRRVDRYTKFSPRWEKYETVFWLPDSFQPPNQELIDEIDSWLTSDRFRTLVFVARDFDASISYWETLMDRETNSNEKGRDPNSAELKRRYHDASTKYLSSRYTGQMESCDWYDVVEHPLTKAKTISGPLVNSIDTSQAEIRYATLPAPGDVTSSGEFGEYSVEVLMSADLYPVVYALEKPRHRDSQIVVVGNASFLLNLPLANKTNREIVVSLIDHVTRNDYAGSEVLFVESGNLPVSDRDSPESQSKWQWITKKPLRYIVPNVLFCCLLFCFVYFPIFGRPKRISRKSTSNFQDHINALGQLMRKTKSTEKPASWIEEYRRRNSRNSHVNNQES